MISASEGARGAASLRYVISGARDEKRSSIADARRVMNLRGVDQGGSSTGSILGSFVSVLCAYRLSGGAVVPKTGFEPAHASSDR